MNQMRRETRALRAPQELARAQEAQAALPHGLVRIPISGGVVEYCRCCGQRTEILDQPEIEVLEPGKPAEQDQYFYDDGGPSRSAWLVLIIIGTIVALLLTVAWWPVPPAPPAP